jgi:pimeloyl-ACP methyl ester carboxylesterase
MAQQKASKAAKRILVGVGVAAGAGVAFVAAREGEKRLAAKLRRPDSPEVAARFRMPEGVEHRELTTYDGGTLHVAEKGHGRPLVLVHGVTLTSEVWAPQFNQLSDHFRVVAIDVRGHGRSVAGSDGYGRDKAAQDLATLLTELDLRGAVVVGHSMGGMILGQFCTNHAEVLNSHVAGLVFMDTAVSQLVPPVLGPVAGRLGAFLVSRQEAGKKVPTMTSGPEERNWLSVRLAFGAHAPTTAVDQVRDMVAAFPPEASLPSWVDLLGHDATEGLGRVTIPAMILVGSRDLLTPVYAARRIAAALPHAELHVLPGAGHQLMQERPDEVAELLRDFTAKLPE